MATHQSGHYIRADMLVSHDWSEKNSTPFPYRDSKFSVILGKSDPDPEFLRRDLHAPSISIQELLVHLDMGP